MHRNIRFTFLLAFSSCYIAFAQAPQIHSTAFSVDADFGRYFYNPSSYQQLYYTTKSQFTYGIKVNYFLSQQTSLFLRLFYAGFKEDRVVYGWLSIGGQYYYTKHTAQSTYNEGLLLLGYSFHVALGSSTTLIPYGGLAFTYVEELEAGSTHSYEFVAPGIGAGIELETRRSQSPLSAFIRLEINYEHRGPESFLRDYGGGLLSLGLRFNFAEAVAAP